MARQDRLQMELFDIMSMTEMLIFHQVYKKLVKVLVVKGQINYILWYQICCWVWAFLIANWVGTLLGEKCLEMEAECRIQA